MSEDEQQTTIVIYYGASRIKTPVDNRISAQYEAAAMNSAREFRRKYDIYEMQKEEAERMPGAAPPDPTPVVDVLNGVEANVLPLRTDAVGRTNDAIAQENRATEAGHTKSNSARRGNEAPTPDTAAVAAAAEKQHHDVIRLLRGAVENELGI